MYEPDPSLLKKVEKRKTIVFIRLDQGEEAKKLEVLDNAIELTTSKDRTLVVPLEKKIDTLTAISSTFEDIVFISAKQKEISQNQ